MQIVLLLIINERVFLISFCCSVPFRKLHWPIQKRMQSSPNVNILIKVWMHSAHITSVVITEKFCNFWTCWNSYPVRRLIWLRPFPTHFKPLLFIIFCHIYSLFHFASAVYSRCCFQPVKSSRLKSSQWCWQTQAPMSLYVRIILETLLQLFNNFQCHIQIDLRYRQGWQCNHI